VSSWIKCYYPDVFAAALLNSQPMGFYQPAQLIIDARRHGVEVLPVDINHSVWDNTLEGEFGVKPHKLRLGFRQVKGLKAVNIEKLVQYRHKHYTRVDELADILSIFTLERLADADAFALLVWIADKRCGKSPRYKIGKLPCLKDRIQQAHKKSRFVCHL